VDLQRKPFAKTKVSFCETIKPLSEKTARFLYHLPILEFGIKRPSELIWFWNIFNKMGNLYKSKTTEFSYQLTL